MTWAKKTLHSPYTLWLALGLLFAFAQLGFDSPDEHFHTLEVAGRLLFDRVNATWEWNAGLRSWFQPLILAAVLKPLTWLGLEDRLWLDCAARAFNVIWMLPCIWAAGRLSSRSAQWWMAASWPLVVWGTRHGSDTFGIPPMLMGLALFFSSRRPWIAGALLGLAFELRYTTAVFSVLAVAIGTLGVHQARLREAARAGVGFIAIAGVLEAANWLLYRAFNGVGHLPAWEFFSFNILQGAGHFHASPWYELLAYNLLLWIPPLGWLGLFRIARHFDSWKPMERWALWTWLASTLVFAFVRHKELRFIFPILPFSLFATVSLLKGWNRKLALGLNAVFLIAAILLYRDPHGSLVRALDRASQESSGSLLLVGISGDFPEFYLRKPMTVRYLSDEEGRAICRERQPGVLVTPEQCSSCLLIEEVPPGLGYRLRQWISHTPAPRFVYRCGA